MAEYQAAECERTGITNMKVGFNSVFGYYLEVTHTHREKIPANYIRKQTLKNAERYITPELKEYEEKVLSAEDKLKTVELDIFSRLRDMVASAAARLQATAEALAEVDVLAALAELARSRNYVRPTVVAQPVLEIEAGRHPVLDITEPDGTFVPNDTRCAARLGNDEFRMTKDEGRSSAHSSLSPDSQPPAPGSLLLITGPNMAGKSTYIRQTALLTLMAQMGSFVPARRATIGVADRIFARVGASDELSRGQSTFMVEMTETARILNTATPRSLVILDEIGRGTSTYDGLSLAWSIVEHIHNELGCRTLFATHYHELTDLEEQLAGVRNYNVAVKEWDDQVVFLHQIVAGAADKSYGIHVAQLAGVPRAVNDRAREVLDWLESQHQAADGVGSKKIFEREGEAVAMPPAEPRRANGSAGASPSRNGAASNWQMTLFGYEEHPLLDEIRAADLDNLDGDDAVALLRAWQLQLTSELVPAKR
jgi:DNA mismatch repair protein MutS